MDCVYEEIHETINSISQTDRDLAPSDAKQLILKKIDDLTKVFTLVSSHLDAQGE